MIRAQCVMDSRWNVVRLTAEVLIMILESITGIKSSTVYTYDIIQTDFFTREIFKKNEVLFYKGNRNQTRKENYFEND